MSSPFFSVIIPVYNGALTIARAIESVRGQGFTELEIIVVDDGSTDDTEKIVRSISDERIIWLSQTNAGPAAARNFGVSHAQGKFLLFLDADDWITADHLASFHESYTKHPFRLALCDIRYTNADGTVLKTVTPWKNEQTLGYGICGSFVIEKKLFDGLGGYDSQLTYSENTDLFLRVELSKSISMTEVAIIPRAAVYIGVVDRRVRSQRYADKKFRSLGYFMNKHRDFFNISEKYALMFKKIYVTSAIESNNYTVARKVLRELLSSQPFNVRTYGLYFLTHLPFLAKLYYRVR